MASSSTLPIVCDAQLLDGDMVGEASEAMSLVFCPLGIRPGCIK
jgi:hypothetical protein